MDSSDDLHLAWSDWTPGNAEILYRRSADAGATWDAIKRLTWTSGETRYPDIAVDSALTVHAVWCDDTSGNFEIYYKSGK